MLWVDACSVVAIEHGRYSLCCQWCDSVFQTCKYKN